MTCTFLNLEDDLHMVHNQLVFSFGTKIVGIGISIKKSEGLNRHELIIGIWWFCVCVCVCMCVCVIML